MSTDASTGEVSTGAASTGVSTGSASTGDASTGASTGFASTGGSTAAAFMGWGYDWRQRMVAGSTDHEKDLARMQRFESPEQLYRSYREIERKMSSGEVRPTLPKNATPQEVAQWRKDNGIPDNPEDYKINMPAGAKPPEEDDVFLKSFLKSAHESDFTQSQVDSAISQFYAEVDRQQEAITEDEKKAEQEAEDKLRQEWGTDYRTNKAMAEALLTRAPEGFRDRFMNGSLEDGTPIRASVEAWKWLVQMEREINPAATVVPGAGGDLGKTIETELNELKAMMADKNSAYWKGPEAEKKQARYRELLTAQEKLKAKSAA